MSPSFFDSRLGLTLIAGAFSPPFNHLCSITKLFVFVTANCAVPSQLDASKQITTNASNYRLLGLAGQGQFGQVYCAVHRATGKLVALKNLEQQRFPTRQFLRELRFLLSLQHPNIVTCLAIEHTTTGRYLVMDYCEGGTMRQLMIEETQLRLTCGLKLIADILKGLENAHKKGIVHCDIKPENILLKLTSKGWIAKISDFGVARLSQELSSHKGGNTGSPAYMAPERFYGQSSQTADLYSVGIMLFELLAGYRPFSGVPSALRDAHLNQPVVFPSVIPDAIRPVIKGALEKLSARRFATASHMLSALYQAAELMQIDLQTPLTAVDEPLLERSSVPMAYPFQSDVQYPIKTAIECFDCAPIQQQQVVILGHSSSAVGTTPSRSSSIPTQETKSQQICYAGGTSVGYFCHGDQQWHTIQVSTPPICNIMGTPHAWFIVTPHSIYQMRLPGVEIGHHELTLIHQFEHDCMITLEPQGTWAAAVSDMRHVSTKGGFSSLTFYPLPNAPSPVYLRTDPIRLKNSGLSSSLLQAIALDRRHVAIFSDAPKPKSKKKSKASVHNNSANPEAPSVHDTCTQIEVITRRGNRVGSLSLPIWIDRIVPTQTPYRFLATDRYDIYSIVQIDLKPFRVHRFAVPLVPKFIAAAPWGYLVMNQDGHMVILDPIGGEMNRIEGPPNPTALTLINPSKLLVSTWDDTHGTLYATDLRNLDLDIVF
jgi:serine/threonine-protein kinase